jgi:hypothetical protein
MRARIFNEVETIHISSSQIIRSREGRVVDSCENDDATLCFMKRDNFVKNLINTFNKIFCSMNLNIAG